MSTGWICSWLSVFRSGSHSVSICVDVIWCWYFYAPLLGKRRLHTWFHSEEVHSARHLPQLQQDTSPRRFNILQYKFSLLFNVHLQCALIVLEFGGATFRRASWTSSTFSVTRQPLAWKVLRGLAILGPAWKTLFGRDQGQSDLSGVEAGHWSVRRWRGKRSHISHQLIITPCDNLKFNIPYQLFLSKYCMGRKWKKQVFSATLRTKWSRPCNWFQPPC